MLVVLHIIQLSHCCLKNTKVFVPLYMSLNDCIRLYERMNAMLTVGYGPLFCFQTKLRFLV